MKRPLSDILPLSRTPTLGALFRKRTRHNPDKIAYTEFDSASDSWGGWTWRQTAEQAARWQAAMLRDGLRPGERVAIMLRNCRAWVLFDQAAQGLGLVTVPIYTNDRAENIGYILQDSGARMLLIENQRQWQDLHPIEDQLAGRLRVAVSGGAPLSVQVARLFLGLGVPVIQGYGLTETGPIVTGNPLENNIPDSIGVDLPGIEVRIGDNDELLTPTLKLRRSRIFGRYGERVAELYSGH